MTNIPLKPANELFTDFQWQSIFDGDDNLLISASAGSGKTTVLVRRVIEKLKNNGNIDELLIVTYTEAAAREMKERIQKALQEAVNQESDEALRQHFTKQLILLPTAHISTLHAFCLTVIRRFYYLIDLDPVFRMLTDETETLLLKEEVWEELREEFYQNNETTFFQLTENFSNDRNDDGLTRLVFSLYEFARANPNPEKWLLELADNYQVHNNLADNPLFQQHLQPIMLATLQEAVDTYQQLERWSLAEEGLIKVADLIIAEKQQLTTILDCLQQSQLDDFYDQLQALTFERYPSIRKEEIKEAAQLIKKQRDAVKKALQDLQKNYFPYSPNEMQEQLAAAYPLVKEMAQVGQAFMTRYYQKKQEKGVLDFNDLEHFTLQILLAKNDENKQEAADFYRNKFAEVLVDEYQDVNRLQEAILFWLRNPNPEQGNMFMVGDVKQSIYSFRLADPTLFIEKYNQFGKEEGGRRIVLAENFRSRKEVLDFTNLIFEQLMDESVGQISYDEAAKLIAGFPNFPESQAFDTEILLYEKETEAEEDSLDEVFVEDKTDGELLMTGLKIRELVDNNFQIYDKKLKENRSVEYRDIVLLTPTKKNNLAILETFKQLGIPLEVNDTQNYFQATEIRTMIALLQIIDNPYQDIPLAAVLRSAIVGLDERELAEIRLTKRQGSFYEALLAFDSQEESHLVKKLELFKQRLASWREAARRVSIAELLWQIYDETAYLEYVLGLAAGKQRYANLLALVQRAEAYEKSSFRGLYQFIRFIEKMQEKDKDLAEPLAASQENAVRVMTIHASKGLEFPIVFVLDMTKRFNLQDTKTRYIFEERAGVGLRYLDPETRVLKDTLPYLAIKQVRLKKLLSEEMRKLYVALTRAEQKLFLVGSYKDQEATFKSWGAVADEEQLVLPATLRLKSQSSLMDWIGMSLVRHPDIQEYWQEGDILAYLKKHPAHFQIHWLNEMTLAEAVTKVQQTTETLMAAPDSQLSSDWQVQAMELLNFNYPYSEATKTTSYQSVSEIKRLFEDPDNEQTNKLVWESQEQKALSQFRYTQEELAKPKFLATTTQPSGAVVGSATHSLLQLLPLEKTPTKALIEEILAQLVVSKQIDSNVAQMIKIDNILQFFETDLGQFIIAHQQLLKREQPFAMLLPANQIFEGYPVASDDLLIHGIIDGYVKLEDQLVLYDYKTDYLADPQDPSAIKAVIKEHIGQLRLYAQALTQAEKLPVGKVFLVLLNYQLVLDVTAEVLEK
ncbi:ATP-dependent helicase/nuclease subunit A [Enterococcus sp. PF1-24]|uniref:helicase-exonuclease AddAB subunit AddA n=1 Tax=unclassified Enterococcus TaxID=2608891 RepID=UPI0024732285|nr:MULTISPECIES: helicase-exonuclease AddAB subunit AddA [unclassified Enterococcus]MDH6365009.1 ATP-dependent helicase/nuclease subunit A [Enterococcus sp. PFB1-1]MDH6402110.1 ATP-dependent helicase/nuclease subunit A [Enterococcus sp. PF1-24]